MLGEFISSGWEGKVTLNWLAGMVGGGVCGRGGVVDEVLVWVDKLAL